jgi:outer membrane protein OmpA-like peptidoglycan-associated protein
VEQGGARTVIEEPGNRTIIEQKGQAPVIRHDETERFRRQTKDVRTERGRDGGNVTIAIRPGGISIYSEFDTSGRLTRRYRKGPDGRELDIIDNRRVPRRDAFALRDLKPPRIFLQRRKYIVNYERATFDDLYEALSAPPIDRIGDGYTLDEIRYNTYLRDRMRRVDLDTVNFDFGRWDVPRDQYWQLERMAQVMLRILDRHPDEVFLVEGHTDAVGSDIDNLTLSDRRAEEVAIILSENFGVPPENLVTQGYGEQLLKVPTQAPERANRRVAVRRITPLLGRYGDR